MHVSPCCLRSTLYRNARRGVILLVLASLAAAQFTPKPKKEKEPRALGLIEIPPKGKPHLIPIAILIDGQFYDASAYKAAPVPLALYSDTVYEGVKSGVSQGLFTVKGALHGNNTWIAEGSWRSAEEIQAATAKKKAPAATKAPAEDADTRPVLRRGGAEKAGGSDSKSDDSKTSDSKSTDSKAPDSKPNDSKTQDSKSKTPSSAGPPPSLNVPSGSAPPSSSPAATSPGSSPAPPASGSATSTASSDASANTPPEPEDKNRPALRRGKPTSNSKDKKDEVGTAPAAATTYSPAKAKPATPTPMYSTSVPAGTQVFAAISDAGGPEPRPYAYQMKSDEEQKFLKKMFGLATTEIQARVKDLAAATTSATPPARATRPGVRSRKTAKAPELDFKDVQLRVFDLSNSNEPVLVLMANARLPHASKPGAGNESATADLQYMVTLVAREDIYADLHKVYASVTDSQHLDISPRVELVDAVDADGDGRGELLFRQVSDAGSAYVLYRVIGNQLWPLFEGAAQ
jgi:hypothetical protein